MKRDAIQSFTEDVMMRGASQYHAPSGLGESFQAGVGLTVMDNLSWSGIFWKDHNAQRRKQIHELHQSGKITDDEVERFRGLSSDWDTEINYDLMAKYLQDTYGYMDILTDGQIKEKNAIQEEDLLGYGREVLERAGPGGKIMGLLGNMVGYSLDPIAMASLFVPVGQAARSAHILSRAARMAGKTMLVEGGLEAVRQPMIYQWRREMGRDYNLKEGLAEVALTTVGAGFLGGAAELAKGIRGFVKKAGDADPDAAQNLKDLADALEKAPPLYDNAETHMRLWQQEIDHLNGFAGVETPEIKVKVSARADTSAAEDQAMNAMLKTGKYEEQKAIIENLKTTASATLDEAGEVTDAIKPLKEVQKDLADINKDLKLANDCFMNAA